MSIFFFFHIYAGTALLLAWLNTQHRTNAHTHLWPPNIEGKLSGDTSRGAVKEKKKSNEFYFSFDFFFFCSQDKDNANIISNIYEFT